jgi:hypothetical protein
VSAPPDEPKTAKQQQVMEQITMIKFCNTHVSEHTFRGRGYTANSVVIDMSKQTSSYSVPQFAIVILDNGKFDTYRASSDGTLTITNIDQQLTPAMQAQIDNAKKTDPWRFTTIAEVEGGELII